MLAEADTIQKAKELKSLALTAGEWAKRKGLGEEAIQHCRSYALEAERKMGEMLAATERAKGTDKGGRKSLDGNRALPPNPPPTIFEIGLTKRESAEAQKLAALPAVKFEALRKGEQTRKEAFNPTHVGHNSGENEWYTPPKFIEAAREAMGSIDCDPASSAIANETVNARKFFTKQQDGLTKEWGANVWLNPPYAQPLIGQFSEVVCKKFTEGEILQATILVNNATETEWFSRMAATASAICFPSTRVKFLDPKGNPSGAPLQGQAVIYFGKNKKRFVKAFESFGFILCKWQEGM